MTGAPRTTPTPSAPTSFAVTADPDVVQELMAILPDHPTFQIQAAVIRCDNNLDRALQQLLDEPPAPANPSKSEDKGKGKAIHQVGDLSLNDNDNYNYNKSTEPPKPIPSPDIRPSSGGGGGGRMTLTSSAQARERASEDAIRAMLLEEQDQEKRRADEEAQSQEAIRAMLDAEKTAKDANDASSQDVITKLLQAEKDSRDREDRASQEAILAMLQREEEERAKQEKANEAKLKSMLQEEQAQRQVELDNKTYPCVICFTECKIEEMYTLEECYHRFCFDCLSTHFRTQVGDGQTRTIKCPTPSCKHIVTYQEIKHVVDPDTFAKYEEFLLRAALGDDPNCRWCPRPGCNNAMIGTPINPMMVCSNDRCRFAFCFNCREEWHADATCAQYQQWKVENNEGEDRFRKWATANTKPCPKCQSSIEKNGGCNHMSCSRCKHQFCWLCLELYKSDHWNNGKCKQYT
eukprot:TRINITY_DN3240_c0_g1_i2.p1 TRINITY_DN3240_c0_g1~~TRINITY_DN3240_c0_g1_i2.p1  ORF type:complete len:524 (-),score=137.32 TRINITY_DN3240_c0_g1_i2:50-1435(-)